MIEALLQKLARLPILFIYAFIGAGAAVENFIPPIPARDAAGPDGSTWLSMEYQRY